MPTHNTIQRVHLVHGFNVKDGGKASVDKFIPFLNQARFITREADYGFVFLLGVRLFNQNFASLLAGELSEGDSLLAHSNGADLIRRISFMNVPKFRAVLINPALDRGTKFGPALERALVLYNHADWATWFAQFLIASPWGSMGCYGYKGKDTRIQNVDCWPIAKGHSGVFEHPEVWAYQIINFLKEGKS